MKNRVDLIIKNFDYLISQYNFHVDQKEFDPQTMGNAVVIFKSQNIGIEIVVDRDQVLISIGNQIDTREKWFDFSDVIKYYAPHIEKAYIFTEKTIETTWDDAVETQLVRLSVILRQYCESVLKGDGWAKEEIKKNEEKRKLEMIKKFNT